VDLHVASSFKINDFSALEHSIQAQTASLLYKIYDAQQQQVVQSASTGQVPSARVLLRLKIKGQSSDVHLRQEKQRWQGGNSFVCV
jgi:hypothetical protein